MVRSPHDSDRMIAEIVGVFTTVCA
jgi:hypothetical protein